MPRAKEVPPAPHRVLNPESRQLHERIAEYVRVGCNLTEVASLLGVDPSTFRSFILRNKKTAQAIIRARSQGNFEIREAQHNMAVDGEHRFSGAMLIWLGKQRLGQADRDSMPPEPVPGIEEGQDVRTFADITTLASEMGPATPLQLEEGDKDFLVVDVDAAGEVEQGTRDG